MIGRILPAVGLFVLGLVLVGAVVLTGLVRALDAEIRAQFDGPRWALPARVFARPLELYESAPLRLEDALLELDLLGYVADGEGRLPGTFNRDGSRLRLTSRAFRFSDGLESSRSVEVSFDGGMVERLRSQDGDAIDLMRIEPLLIGSIHDAQGEDRVLVRIEDVPAELIAALLAIEDRRFFVHRGLDPLGIARAAVTNLRAGRTVQGGSTLTQQLVKNFYLTQARTFERKASEALMALIIEHRYSKLEILEAYLNEVFLGQSGRVAIHGFGTAAEFYFRRPLNELRLDQIAMLVGMARGASFYDPRRHPERTRDRRNLVISQMQSLGLVDAETAQVARERPIEVSPRIPRGESRYPAFLDLVRRQLREEYREEDLQSEGLRIFTTLSPVAQAQLEQRLVAGIAGLRTSGEGRGDLQMAAVLTDALSGEVRALIGDADPRFPGFNRAVQARRPIGSLLKPFIVLTAVSDPMRYSLASTLDDSPFEMRLPNGQLWAPQNFDRRFRGSVTVWEALVRSYNVPMVRLSESVGIERVLRLMQTLGLESPPRPLPSVALGAVDLSPLEVAGLYQALANGGYATRGRVIRDVLDANDRPLSHYPLELRGAVPDGAVYLVREALRDVLREGTGAAVGRALAPGEAAGKTGTSNDRRDSWFAGFDDERVLVVWVGFDDNRATPFTGASGAGVLWGEAMSALGAGRLRSQIHPEVVWARVDRVSGLRVETTRCTQTVDLPFWRGSEPSRRAACDFPSDPAYDPDGANNDSWWQRWMGQ